MTGASPSHHGSIGVSGLVLAAADMPAVLDPQDVSSFAGPLGSSGGEAPRSTHSVGTAPRSIGSVVQKSMGSTLILTPMLGRKDVEIAAEQVLGIVATLDGLQALVDDRRVGGPGAIPCAG